MSERHRWDWRKDKFLTRDGVLRDVFTTDGRTVDPAFELPRRHEKSFEKELGELFDTYQERVERAIESRDPSMSWAYSNFPDDGTRRICDGILSALQSLHDGFPSKAYKTFAKMMDDLTDAIPLPRVRDAFSADPLTYKEHNRVRPLSPESPRTEDAAMAEQFYRVRSVSYGSTFPRCEIFHTPANLRDKISTTRYSIAGYPSLYLADALELSMQEMGKPYHSIASCFEITGTCESESALVIDLGIRPQDFLFPEMDPPKDGTTEELGVLYTCRYVFWFPLLAACSFVRENPSSSYSDEYAIPQLLMQWLRLSKKPPQNMKYPDGPIEVEDAYDLAWLISSDYVDDLEEALLIFRGADEPFDTQPRELGSRELELVLALAKALQDIVSQLVKLTLQYPGLMFPRDFYDLLKQISHTLFLLREYLGNSSKDALSRLRSIVLRILSQLSDNPHLLERDLKTDEKVAGESALRDKLLSSFGYTRRLLAWLDDYRIVGIRYFSCKDLYAPLLGRNYVFPSERITLDRNGEVAKDGEGLYSSQLNRLFSWSVPRHREDYESVQEWQDGLDEELRRSPGNLSGDTPTK